MISSGAAALATAALRGAAASAAFTARRIRAAVGALDCTGDADVADAVRVPIHVAAETVTGADCGDTRIAIEGQGNALLAHGMSAAVRAGAR